MALDVNETFITNYLAEYQHALQVGQSLLRDRVFVKSNVVGSSTRFPILAATTVETNRARHTILSGDGDAHSYVDCTLSNQEAWKFIDSLDEFKTNIDLRKGYTESIVMALNDKLDGVIVDAVVASNTSAGSAAAFDAAKVRAVRKLAGRYKWAKQEKWTWVVTPAIYEKLLGLTEVASRDFTEMNTAVTGGKRAVEFMGFTFIESSILEDETGTGSTQNSYVFTQNSVGLAVGRDITPKIERSPAHNSTILLGEMSVGAVSIQATGVLEVAISGL